VFGRYSQRDILVLGAIILLFLWYSGLLTNLQRNPWSVVALVIALAIGITVHEANHAWVATLLGDPTPKLMGRVSLNPLRHLDPIGTLMIFIAHFGWGKPVVFNPFNLRINPQIGSAMVALAGPVANIAAAILFLLPLRYQQPMDPRVLDLIRQVVSLNIGLAAFNLIPIPPLDGFGVLSGVLPRQFAPIIEPLRTYGVFILLGLVFLPTLGGPDVLGMIMRPILRTVEALVRGVALGV